MKATYEDIERTVAELSREESPTPEIIRGGHPDAQHRPPPDRRGHGHRCYHARDEWQGPGDASEKAFTVRGLSGKIREILDARGAGDA